MRTKIITEYRQTGGDSDGDNVVGTGWGWVQNILPCHPLIQRPVETSHLDIRRSRITDYVVRDVKAKFRMRMSETTKIDGAGFIIKYGGLKTGLPGFSPYSRQRHAKSSRNSCG